MIDTSRIDRVLRDAVRLPGIVALATTADETIYQGAFGRRDVSQPAPMTADTVFYLASMTKAVTSVAAMQLVEQGRLSLDAPIGEVLPALASPNVLHGFDASGDPILRPASRPVTLRQLLSHSSGYGYVTWNADLLRFHERTGIPAIPANWDEMRQIPLLFEPGTRWNYSISTDLVGRAVEAVSGETLEAYILAHVLAPLGMHDTAATLSPQQRSRAARVHARQPDGGLVPIEHSSGNGMGFFGGGGGLCGTGPDYLRFLRMLLAGGQGVLRAETVAEMARNNIGEMNMLPMRSALPARSNDADFFPEIAKKWGLGFLINTADVPGRRRAGSLAWAGLANTYFWIDLDAGIAGAILMQVLPFADARALDVLEAFETAVYASL